MRFSERIGKVTIEVPLQVNSIDTNLRNSLWNAVYIFYVSKLSDGYNWSDRQESFFVRITQLHFFKLPLDELPKYGNEYKSSIKSLFFNWEWYEVYDYVEWLGSFGAAWNSWRPGEKNHDRAKEFRQATNTVLSSENSGYRFINLELVPVTAQSEIDEIERALSEPSKFAPVSSHIATATSLLSDRKNPDFRNSIKESISAVEAAAKIVTNNPNATLGDALRTLEKETQLHRALKEGFSKLYGWTSDSDGIRHAMMETPNLTLADARFMLVACSAFSNYLIDRSAAE